MRRYSHQAFINWSKLFFKKGYWDWKWLTSYGWEWVVKKPDNNRNLCNTIFDRKSIRLVRDEIKELGKFHSGWFQRVFEPETYGIRAWEYGVLMKKLKNFRQKHTPLSNMASQLPCPQSLRSSVAGRDGQVNINKMRILDIGTGPSLFPEYLSSLGAKVISLDINKTDKPWPAGKDDKVDFVQADMCQMPFDDKEFDLVISISAIEHLDNWQKITQAIKEMVRVSRSKGIIYLTTDFYLPRQKTDNWNSGGRPKEAYSWDKLTRFIEIFADAGVDIDFSVGESKDLLLSSPRFSNYRGRYFTTANLCLPASL